MGYCTLFSVKRIGSQGKQRTKPIGSSLFRALKDVFCIPPKDSECLKSYWRIVWWFLRLFMTFLNNIFFDGFCMVRPYTFAIQNPVVFRYDFDGITLLPRGGLTDARSLALNHPPQPCFAASRRSHRCPVASLERWSNVKPVKVWKISLSLKPKPEVS